MFDIKIYFKITFTKVWMENFPFRTKYENRQLITSNIVILKKTLNLRFYFIAYC